MRVQVKVTGENYAVQEFEYPKLEVAIIELGKLLGKKLAAPGTSRAEPARSPESPVVGPDAASTTAATNKRGPGRPRKNAEAGAKSNTATAQVEVAPSAPASVPGVTDASKVSGEDANSTSTVPVEVPAAASAPQQSTLGVMDWPLATGSAPSTPGGQESQPQAAATASTVADPKLTVGDVQKAIQKLFEAKGVNAVWPILGKYGAKTYREVKPESFAACIADCEGAL